MTESGHSPLKKRIVGAIVLISLAVIFIPMFLSSEKPYDDGMPVFGSNIPKQPAKLEDLKANELVPVVPKPDVNPVAQIPVDKDTPNIKPEDIQTITPEKPAPIDNDTSTKSEKNNNPAKNTSSASTSAYAVQVASFSSRKNALRLRDKLRGKSYRSFVEAIKTEKGLRYRVRVGPEVSKSDALKMQSKIKQQFKLSGMVVQHP